MVTAEPAATAVDVAGAGAAGAGAATGEMTVLAAGVAMGGMRGLVLQSAAMCCLLRLRLLEEAHRARPASIRSEFWRLAARL
jgi:hypothetical protein